jgi:cation diffusion facilitator family transporter
MLLDLVLGVAKIVGGLLGNSYALVTDGIHSLTDAFSDVFVIILSRIGRSEPDAEHPWGHGRFETLGTVAMGVLFFTTAGIIIFDGVQRLINESPNNAPGTPALLIALLSIGLKEWIFRYTLVVANKLNSSLLKANAWHSRSDAFSSIAVLAGVSGAMLGYYWMDLVAALVVALIIAKIGWGLCTDALKELVDTAVPQQRRMQIERTIQESDEIQGISGIRSRQSGGSIILEVSLLVDPTISVSRGHQIGEDISKSLKGRFSDVNDVVVHIDPVHEAPLACSTNLSSSLPGDALIIAEIKQRWSKILPAHEIESLALNHQSLGVVIDLTVTRPKISEKLAKQLQTSLSSLSYVASLKIYTKAFDDNTSH